MGTRGFEYLTEGDARKLGKHESTRPKGSKYRNVKVVVDGITFDSKREAHRYQELKLMQHAGQIRSLRWQPRYTLFALTIDRADLRDANAGNVTLRRQVVCEYVGDFDYVCADGVVVVEDVKSPATRRKEVYRLKRKLFEAQYGIRIVEVR